MPKGIRLKPEQIVAKLREIEVKTDQLTKRIFSETVELMRSTQSYFLKDIPFTDQGAFAASQLLVTLNFNYVMNAMPGLPRSAVLRHQLIGQCVYSALIY